VNNLPKVVTQRCLEQDLNLRPTDCKPKCLTVAPPRHLSSVYTARKSFATRIYDVANNRELQTLHPEHSELAVRCRKRTDP